MKADRQKLEEAKVTACNVTTALPVYLWVWMVWMFICCC